MKKITLSLIYFLIFSFSYSQNTCENATPITAGTYYIDGIDGQSVPLQCQDIITSDSPNGNMELSLIHISEPTRPY